MIPELTIMLTLTRHNIEIKDGLGIQQCGIQKLSKSERFSVKTEGECIVYDLSYFDTISVIENLASNKYTIKMLRELDLFGIV